MVIKPWKHEKREPLDDALEWFVGWLINETSFQKVVCHVTRSGFQIQMAATIVNDNFWYCLLIKPRNKNEDKNRKKLVSGN